MLHLFTPSLLSIQGTISPAPVRVSLLSNNSYSWWCKPISTYDTANAGNYFTTIGPNGEHFLHFFNGATTASLILHTGLAKDEHNTAAFLVQSDHILCAWTGHNTDDFWVQKIKKDLSGSISSKLNIGATSTLTTASYTQLVEAGGKLFLFCRSQLYHWRICYSEDGGTSWSVSKRLFSKTGSGPYLYLLHQKIGPDTIQLGLAYHPNQSAEGANRFCRFELNGSSGELSSGGVVKGNVFDSGYTAIAVQNEPPVFTAGSGKRFRFLDMTATSAYTCILLAEYTTMEEGDYLFLKIDNSTNQVTQQVAVVAHGKDTFTSYFGGAYFVQSQTGVWNNVIYLCREAAGIWYAEKWGYNGASFSLSETIETMPATTAGLSLTRPQPPQNAATGGLRAMYQKGDYNESYTSWTNELIGIL
jgi:hypothetical protein